LHEELLKKNKSLFYWLLKTPPVNGFTCWPLPTQLSLPKSWGDFATCRLVRQAENHCLISRSKKCCFIATTDSGKIQETPAILAGLEASYR
jgi:hypothetical protein